MTGGRLAVPPRTRSAMDGLTCCRLKQIIYTGRERERDREGGVQRISAHACALCTSIIHVGPTLNVRSLQEMNNVM